MILLTSKTLNIFNVLYFTQKMKVNQHKTILKKIMTEKN